MVAAPPISKINWRISHRIIRSIYPPIALFEDIADPADWELIASLEAKTNPRVRDEIGDISLVPIERRVAGPGRVMRWPLSRTSPATGPVAFPTAATASGIAAIGSRLR
jgi:hypothetical protein